MRRLFGFESGCFQSLKEIFRDSGSALILLNKLVEDQRYDDAIKVFEFGSQRGFTTTSGRNYPTDVVMLAIEALYRQVNDSFLDETFFFPMEKFQNTKQSLGKAKELISNVMQRDSDINPRTASLLALLAIEQVRRMTKNKDQRLSCRVKCHSLWKFSGQFAHQI